MKSGLTSGKSDSEGSNSEESEEEEKVFILKEKMKERRKFDRKRKAADQKFKKLIK